MMRITFDVNPNEIVIAFPDYKLIVALSNVKTAEDAYHALMHLADDIRPMIEQAVLDGHEEEWNLDRH